MSNRSLRLRCVSVQISKGVGGCLHLHTDRLIGETTSRERLLSWVCARASLSCLAWVLGYRACDSPTARLLFLARASAPAGPRAGHPRCPANHTQSGQHDAVQQCVALLRHVSTHSSGRAKAPCAGSRLLPLFHTLPTHSTQESLERRASLSPVGKRHCSGEKTKKGPRVQMRGSEHEALQLVSEGGGTSLPPPSLASRPRIVR